MKRILLSLLFTLATATANAGPDNTIKLGVIYTYQYGQYLVNQQLGQQLPFLNQTFSNASIVGASLQTTVASAAYEDIKAFTDPGLDGHSLSTTINLAMLSTGISALRDQVGADVIVVYAMTLIDPSAPICGATLAPNLSFSRGYFNPDPVSGRGRQQR